MLFNNVRKMAAKAARPYTTLEVAKSYPKLMAEKGFIF